MNYLPGKEKSCLAGAIGGGWGSDPKINTALDKQPQVIRQKNAAELPSFASGSLRLHKSGCAAKEKAKRTK